MILNAVQARDLALEIGQYIEASPSGIFDYTVIAKLEAISDERKTGFVVRAKATIATVDGAVFKFDYYFSSFDRWNTLCRELLDAGVIGIPKEKSE